MRIPAGEALFIGQHQCPEFDCSQKLPEELKILLCFLDGAERRQQLQAKINAAGREAAEEQQSRTALS
jgi:hypothetical protein